MKADTSLIETRRIGDILRARGALSAEDLAKALAIQSEIGGLLGQVLHRIGAVTEETLVESLSAQLGLPTIEAKSLPADKKPFRDAAARLGLPAFWFMARRAACWFENQGSDETGARLCVVSGDPLSASLREGVEAALARSDGGDTVEIVYFLADNQTIDNCVARYQPDDAAIDDDMADAGRLRELAEEAPVIDYVNNLFSSALKENASDIHIEAYTAQVAVRYRIDGVLHERASIARSRFEAIASRIKLISGMDIAERRLPQDGRTTVRFAGKEVDLRVSAVPSTWGESIVIRLLRKQTELPDLVGLGLQGRTHEVFLRTMSTPNGVFLVTGPTGSGKSTTLYRGLEHINNGERKIITIEDPVEYDVAGVVQIQVRNEIGYSFAKGLRAVLRQDPDIIMVGEIRDGETATIAAQAALTGHFVLSTLHTNSALAAVTRLRDIGLASYLIGDSLRGLMAQRLVRRLCDHCAEPADKSEVEAFLARAKGAATGVSADDIANDWRRPVGCEMCNATGYKGRIALAEIVEIDGPLREAIAQAAPVSAMLERARAQGFQTLFEDGVMKASQGVTSVAEVLRVCSGDYV